MYSDEEHVYLALRAGAAGYLLKGAAREELSWQLEQSRRRDISQSTGRKDYKQQV